METTKKIVATETFIWLFQHHVGVHMGSTPTRLISYMYGDFWDAACKHLEMEAGEFIANFLLNILNAALG